MCGGGGKSSTPASPPPAPPVQGAELKVGDSESINNKKKRKGSAKLTVPIQKTTAPTTGLNIPSGG